MLICGNNGDGRHLVVLDELKTRVPQEANLLWHVGGELDLDEKSMRGRIVGRRSELHFALSTSSRAELASRSHSLEHNHIDRFLDLAIEEGPSHVVTSVFSDSPLDSAVTTETDEDGLKLSFGDMKLKFQSGNRYLIFEGTQ